MTPFYCKITVCNGRLAIQPGGYYDEFLPARVARRVAYQELLRGDQPVSAELPLYRDFVGARALVSESKVEAHRGLGTTVEFGRGEFRYVEVPVKLKALTDHEWRKLKFWHWDCGWSQELHGISKSKFRAMGGGVNTFYDLPDEVQNILFKYYGIDAPEKLSLPVGKGFWFCETNAGRPKWAWLNGNFL